MSDNAFSVDSADHSPWPRLQVLVAQATDRDDFYRQFLLDFSQRSAAEMGLAWDCDEARFAPICQVQRDASTHSRMPVSQERHTELLTQARTGESALMVTVPDQSGMEQAILIGPVHRRESTELVEFLLPATNSSEANQTALQQLADCCRLAREFGETAVDAPAIEIAIPEPSPSQAELPPASFTIVQLDEFVRQVHSSLDYDRTASNVVNELRRVLRCDRVTYLARRGRGYRAISISGQPSVNRRSNVVAALETLVLTVSKSNRVFWYPADEELPPQIEQRLDEYIDLSMTCSMVVTPIYGQSARKEDNDGDGAEAPEIIGAMVIERASSEWDRAEIEPAVHTAMRHATDAIRNAHRVRQIPLYPLLHTFGQTRLAAERHLYRSILAVTAIIGLALALVFVQVEHRLTCEGVLRPTGLQRVFAQQDGVVQQIHVEHGSRVKAGELLVTLHNHDLELELEQLTGELDSLRQKLGGSRSMRIRSSQRETIPGQVNQQEIEAQIASLELQIRTTKEQQQRLRVLAPIDGEVLTWDLNHRLGLRPVVQGDLLIEVGDTDGPWQIRLDLPDRKAGHLLRAAGTSEDPLRVEFALALDPARHFVGEVSEIAKATSVSADHLHVVRVDAEVDEEQIAGLKQAGSTVSAKILCGRRSLGYVWFHQVWEFIQYRVLFPIS